MADLDLIRGAIRPTLVRMTLPMMMGIVSLMLFNLADVYFVSQLGTREMASLAFTFPVTFAVISLAIGFGIGTSATLAKLIGGGKTSQAAKLATDNLMMTFLLVVFISVVARFFMVPLFNLLGASEAQMPFILDYMDMWWFGAAFVVSNMVANSSLRAKGDTKTPALVMAVSSAANLILDPLFIFGWGPIPGMGIQGAALASVTAWMGVFVYVVYILFHKYQLLVVQPPQLKRILSHWMQVMKIGIPAAVSNMLTPIAGGVLTALVAQHGAEAVAAFGVGNRLESLSLLACLALSMTLPPFVSQNFGANQIARVEAAYKGAIKFALGWQLIVFVVLFLLQDVIAGAFADSSAVEEPLALWISIVPLGFGMQAVIFLSASTLNALHQPMQAMRISVIRLFVFFIPLAWIANYFAGLEAMFSSFVVANALTAVIAYFRVSRLLKRKAVVNQ
ncbi:MATE family efflux transporter [Neptunomonas sp. XY-337]|uniref:MATE family efflux transporter n=1 Tax=Neptunomonas sp. XY-337 TaxID=2561897 RepID=UPI0010A99EF3|nr:MATE family efflux transporter [Neptunomonas sp. XY-337]